MSNTTLQRHSAWLMTGSPPPGQQSTPTPPCRPTRLTQMHSRMQTVCMPPRTIPKTRQPCTSSTRHSRPAVGCKLCHHPRCCLLV
jgi:hypothetical protein